MANEAHRRGSASKVGSGIGTARLKAWTMSKADLFNSLPSSGRQARRSNLLASGNNPFIPPLPLLVLL